MPRAGITRDRLIEAAAALADEQGFAGLTLAALARHFDVKLPSLYSHVRNSDDLRSSVASLAFAALADRAETAIAGLSGKDALVALANTHRSFALHHGGLSEATRFPFDVAGPVPDGAMRMAKVSLAVLDDYPLSATDRIHATRLLASFFLGFPMLEQAGSFDHRQPAPEASWLIGLDALDALLRSWSTPAHHPIPTK